MLLIIKGLALHFIFSFNPTSCISCRGRPGSLVIDLNPLPLGPRAKVKVAGKKEKFHRVPKFSFCCVQFVVLRVGKPINKASTRLNRRLLLLWLRLPPEAADTAGSCHFLSPAADGVQSPSERRKQSGSLSQLVSVAPIRLRTALRRCESDGKGPGRLCFFVFFCLSDEKKEGKKVE